MEAAHKGYTEIVDELARRGADLNMRTVRMKLITFLSLESHAPNRKLVSQPSMLQL